MTDSQKRQHVTLEKTPTVVDLAAMKKFILSQIGGITPEDLDVMSNEQITTFYQELSSCHQPSQQNNKNDHQVKPIENKQQNIQNDKIKESQNNLKSHNNETEQNKKPASNSKYQQTQVNSIILINIDDRLYYKPKYTEQIGYKLENSRLQVSFGPLLYDVQSKRKAITSCYNSSMAEVIQAMKNKQIQDSYLRLRNSDHKKLLSGCSQHQFKPRQICVYVPRLQINQNFKLPQSSDIQNNLNTKKNTNNLGTPPKKQSYFIPKQGIQQNQINQIQNDQFFDQLVQCGAVNQKKIIIQNQNRNQQPKSQKGIKNAFQMAKNKQKKDREVQTQNIKNREHKIKTKLNIVQQIQYVQDQSQNQSSFFTKRPSDDQSLILSHPSKIIIQKFKNSLLQPGQQPKKQVLDWIQNLRVLTNKFQQTYMSQFKNSWNIIKD